MTPKIEYPIPDILISETKIEKSIEIEVDSQMNE